MDPVSLALVWYVVFLLSMAAHEASHALVALKLGDPTGYRGGQVTLNPWPHIRREPIGTVVMPLLSYASGGWMIGWASAPYDPTWAARHPRRAGLMALAGPFANALLAIAAGVLLRFGVWTGFFGTSHRVDFARLAVAPDGFPTYVVTAASLCLSINLILSVFNLLPVPPLDGSAVVYLAMPENVARRVQATMRGSAARVGLLALLVAWQVAGPVLQVLFLGVVNLVYYPIVHYGP